VFWGNASQKPTTPDI